MRSFPAQDGLDGEVHRFKKAGAVAGGELRIETAAFAGFAQVALQFAHRKGRADAGVRERLAGGPTTFAPILRHRAASGISAVTAMSAGPIRSAIQSSAASGPSATTTRLISGLRSSRIQLFDTICTRSSYRAATRSTSAFTGHASAST